MGWKRLMSNKEGGSVCSPLMAASVSLSTTTMGSSIPRILGGIRDLSKGHLETNSIY